MDPRSDSLRHWAGLAERTVGNKTHSSGLCSDLNFCVKALTRTQKKIDGALQQTNILVEQLAVPRQVEYLRVMGKCGIQKMQQIVKACGKSGI